MPNVLSDEEMSRHDWQKRHIKRGLMNNVTFYDQQYLTAQYACEKYAKAAEVGLRKFIEEYSLEEKTILDLGCGRGWFQKLSPNWMGLDISQVAGRYSNGRFMCGSAESIPIRSGSIPAIWSITFLEHSPEPEKALREIERLLTKDGVIYLAPAWRVPPWRPKGYEVKSYKELDIYGKLIKFILPMLNFVWTKAVFWILRRLFREFFWILKGKRQTTLKYTSFKPNFDLFLLPDSDACNSLDNHEVLLWFLSRGFIEKKNTDLISRVLLKCGPVVVTKNKNVLL
jgi:SAM-dependent methyltransferase